MAVAVRTMTGAPAPLRTQQAVAQRTERPAALPALTGLRFGAALAVAAGHFLMTWRPATLPLGAGPGPLRAAEEGLRAVAQYSGPVAVSLFFILSGFILGHSYLDAGGRFRGTRRGFWVARAARIYPAYLLGFLLAAGPFLWAPPPGAPLVPTALATLALLQGWMPAWATAWNDPGWSLSVEALFYALFPLLAPALARVPARRLVRAMALCWAAALTPALVYLAVRPDGAAYVSGWAHAWWLHAVICNPLTRLPEFALGVLLARHYARERARTRARGGPPAGARLAVPALLSVLALLCVSGGPLLGWVLPRTGLFDPVLAALIYALAWGRGRLARTLATPALLLLGEASYALYILHAPLFAWLDRALPAPQSGAGAAAWGLCFLVLATALAVLVLHGLEQPARRAIRARWG